MGANAVAGDEGCGLGGEPVVSAGGEGEELGRRRRAWGMELWAVFWDMSYVGVGVERCGPCRTRGGDRAGRSNHKRG